MAVLSKIRERSLFLIIIIGLALFAFVLDPSTLSDFFNATKINEVGQVNGEPISRDEYNVALEQYRQQNGNRMTEMQSANAVWDNLVRKAIYKNELANVGVTIGEADVWNELLNSPSITDNAQFFNEAGLFDENKLKQFLVDTQSSNPELWASWSNYMNSIKENLERTTYNNLLSAGLGASLRKAKTNTLWQIPKLMLNMCTFLIHLLRTAWLRFLNQKLKTTLLTIQMNIKLRLQEILIM